MLKSLHHLFRCRTDRILGYRRLAGLNPASETLAKQTYWAEFHRSRKLAAAARAGALGLRAHGPNRPSAATSAKSYTTLHRVLRNRQAQRLANWCPVSQAIACSFILARQITFRNKITNRWCTAASRVDNELRRWGGSKLTGGNRVVSQTLATYPHQSHPAGTARPKSPPAS
jgi:hypothetical protein